MVNQLLEFAPSRVHVIVVTIRQGRLARLWLLEGDAGGPEGDGWILYVGFALH